MPIDVALIHISPPDEHGFCSYGVGVDATKTAVENARTVIAMVPLSRLGGVLTRDAFRPAIVGRRL